MNKISKLKSSVVIALLGMSMSSCSDWLEVTMEDKIMENALFSEYSGYMTALNGVYLSMNDLYSRNLTTGPIDVMAQYYNVTENNNHSLKIYATYSYNDNAFDSPNNTLWSKAYEILANINVIIERTNGDNPLNELQYGVIRGEALALRAFIHFDLLRLYGPIYSENPDATSIPYQNSSKREISPLLPANEALELIIKDLHEAEGLLVKVDPIITEGVRNTATEDNGLSVYDYSFRQLRLNYYAVEALLARAYLWKGDKATAYDIAKHNIIDKVTSDELEVFPWTTKEAVTADGKPDLLFSSEVMFSLYNSDRESIHNAYFAPSLRATTSRLTFIGANRTGDSKVATMYDDDNDLRLNIWSVVEPTQAELKDAEENNTTAETTLAMMKYGPFSNNAETDGTETYRYMIPLIRLSEIYLIAAECTSSQEEAIELINTIRFNRSCENIGPDVNLEKTILYEMAREVIGEGQLFFFYKRHASEELISGTAPGSTYTMQKSYYVWPLPKAETEKRVLVNGN